MFLGERWHRKPLLKHIFVTESRYRRDKNEKQNKNKNGVPLFPNLTWFVRACAPKTRAAFSKTWFLKSVHSGLFI